ncbi:hypothetical protein DVH24_020858 [Malus domestica]|uniref:Chalcone/stilbene synthase N-terminal domain-containing protein n=1 Tax=Malus domestica TaxID=3750 RepID=A0A498JAG2_MALDO|nr:hypothetical protein DVH24_020858 [Malus domestica]
MGKIPIPSALSLSNGALVKNHVEPQHAKILAIGTANPPNVYYQKDYPDFLFRVTKKEHITDLKEKFDRICNCNFCKYYSGYIMHMREITIYLYISRIKKCYLYLTEELLKANPNIYTYGAPSLDVSQDMLNAEVPKLGQQAALKAIKEWGQPISEITHLIFRTASCVHHILCGQFSLAGCYAGATVLRLAKDFAENNEGARVFVVCAKIFTLYFHELTDTHVDILVGQALFANGASAVIVGANPDPETESSLFEIMACRQTIVPNSEHGVVVHIREIGRSPKTCWWKCCDYVTKTFEEVDGKNRDWNFLFFSEHLGGRAIVDQVEEQLSLKERKLRAIRHV